MSTLSTFEILFILLCVINLIASSTDYNALYDKCINVRDNVLISPKRVSVFKHLFNDNYQTTGMVFLYQPGRHGRNIYHILSWYLSHFHDIISSQALIQTLEQRIHQKQTVFTIHIVFPKFPSAGWIGYQWAAELLKAYPFKLRWNDLFDTIKVEIHYAADVHSTSSNASLLIFNLMRTHNIRQCIQLNRRYKTLLEYKRSDWIAQHQPVYPFLSEWANHFKSIHHITPAPACDNDKWRIGVLQRKQNDRYLRDNATERDILESLTQGLNLDLFQVSKLSFELNNSSPIDQARFMNDHDIIIGAHGAGLTNLIFMDQNDRTCDGKIIRHRPVLMEIGFRYLYHAVTDESEYFYKKSEFFSLLYAVNHSRFIEVNAVRYGRKYKGGNILYKTSIFVIVSFLIGEIEAVYADNGYDFEDQKRKYKDSVYNQEGMLFPGEGRPIKSEFDAYIGVQCMFILALFTLIMCLRAMCRRKSPWRTFVGIMHDKL